MLRWIVITWLPALVLLRWLDQQSAIPLSLLLIEPVATAKLPWYTGAISTLGCFLWIGAGAVALFAAGLCSGRHRACLVIFGLLSLWLGLDDAFLLHEIALPQILPLPQGWDSAAFQRSLYVVYLLAFAGWGLAFRHQLKSRDLVILACSCLWLGLSMGIDVVIEADLLDPYSRLVRDKNYALLVEDGSKLLGLLSWMTFSALISSRLVEGERNFRAYANSPLPAEDNLPET